MRIQISLLTVLLLAGCASQAPQPQPVEPPVSTEQQTRVQQLQQSQQELELGLKRKIAVGRISNETNYGRSLLREAITGEHDQKIADMFVQALSSTQQFLIFERPDIALLEAEMQLQQKPSNLVGVDTMILGSLTEFGRATTGERGFLSTSQRQVATAKVDLRIVDVHTGEVIAAVSGSGDSSVEQSRIMGFGSVAGYDGSLNDRAIGAAVSAAVENMLELLLLRPWTADLLAQEDERLFMSGGEAQGVKPGMRFDVMTKGQQVRSSTTDALITLPGRKIAVLEVDGLFGQSTLDQGAYGRIVEGDINGYALEQLEIRKGD